jgi:hypothetical protein
VLDVGEDQLLVLLLVVQAELDHVAHSDVVVGSVLGEQLSMPVDVARYARTSSRDGRVSSRARARVLLADRVVVGVEEHPRNAGSKGA